MPIVSILSAKGGVGKTTLAANIGSALQRRGKRVLLVDTDDQGSLRSWAARRSGEGGPGVVAIEDAQSLASELPTLASAYDVVVIDGAGRIEGITGAAVRVADVVLIPVRPSPLDLWASRALVNVVKERQVLAGGRPRAAFVVSQAVTGANLSAQMTEALAAFEIPALEARTGGRVAYAESMITGGTVLDASSSKAAAEIEAITSELSELLIDE